MNRAELNGALMRFIDRSPNAYCAAALLAERLEQEGFSRLCVDSEWNVKPGGRYYTLRGDSTVAAFKVGQKRGFITTAVHTDSPAFRLKPNTVINENGYIKLNTDLYGGIIFYSWLDRPLSIAGRAFFERDGRLEKRIVNAEKPVAIIPSLAIHLNREVNKGVALNPQIDMLPIAGFGGEQGLESLLQSLCGCSGRLVDYDLFLYPTCKAQYAGVADEFIVAPRLDDLASLVPALEAFIATDSPATSVFCAFNNEEIGSRTMQGADSTFLSDVFSEISRSLGRSALSDLALSFMVSADNAHALHPNAPAKSDPTNRVELGKGVVIKRHDHYSTDGLSAALFKRVCERAGAACQDFASRSDGSCGGTLGVISLGHLSIPSVDIGIPQLAMHSAVETISSADPYNMYLALCGLYSSSVELSDQSIDLLNK